MPVAGADTEPQTSTRSPDHEQYEVRSFQPFIIQLVSRLSTIGSNIVDKPSTCFSADWACVLGKTRKIADLRCRWITC